jgi:hypothetical protein
MAPYVTASQETVICLHSYQAVAPIEVHVPNRADPIISYGIKITASITAV